MSQIKVYALATTLEKHLEGLSTAIHQALVSELKYPIEKKFQRFIALGKENFIYPNDRSENYIIIEISMFEGRTIESKKAFIKALFHNIEQACDIAPQDVEITIFETPKENWGIRGKNADELALNYQVNV